MTQYLTEGAVRKTLADLGDPAPGSGLAVTYVRKAFRDGQAMYGAEAAYQDFVVKQGSGDSACIPGGSRDSSPNTAGANVSRSGPDEYADRYLRPAGRTITASEIERAVYAER